MTRNDIKLLAEAFDQINDHPNSFTTKLIPFMHDCKQQGMDINEFVQSLRDRMNIRYENLDTEKQKAILKTWKDIGGWIDYKKNPNLQP